VHDDACSVQVQITAAERHHVLHGRWNLLQPVKRILQSVFCVILETLMYQKHGKSRTYVLAWARERF
jgi:hypothetical protein